MSQNILLIEDDLSYATAIREALIRSNHGAFQVEWVRHCIEGLERLVKTGRQEQSRPDGIAAVLANLFLADSHGIGTFDRLFCAAPEVPILVLSATQDEETAKLAVQHGAQDYLLKAKFDGDSFPKVLASIVERAASAEALFEAKEHAQMLLNSIGDGVMSIDVWGHVTYLNAVAETLTGWSRAEAAGRPLAEVFRIIDATSREVAQNSMLLAMRQDKTVGLTPNRVLVRRDGVEAAIEDSASPIHDRNGHVTGAVMVFHDVSVARALTARMSYLAQHDSLTALPNRMLLTDRLTQMMSLAQRHQQKIAVLYVDLDCFKHINDSLGHGIGDRVLQSVAQRLLSSVRSSDTISRYGGDEFVILLADAVHAQDALVSVDKILLALAAPHRVEQHDLSITASIGIAIYPDDGTDAATLIKHADFAMLHAKDSGRNSYQFFKPEMNKRAVARQSLETDLRHALERQQFLLHYQPKMNLESGAVVGVEALIRWRHPQRGLVAPGYFIPAAEESGCIVPISRWVLREGCRQARAWHDAGLPAICIAINTSAIELRSKDFVTAVRAILTETGLEPRYLEIELTEAFLMQDPKSTTAVLQELKDVGVQLTLDDFGTGFSSLSYLKRFPIDTLKIDQSFVRDLMTDADDASIVRAVISMGQSLHKQVVAEGVETREQLEFLRAHACPEGQGFYFSHPVTAGELGPLLGRNVVEPRSQQVY
ncbi:MAG TPA: EAL domain-containing protein [Steroidobacteraceae bacterium]|jgi:diguanylate cyclase (GGDEF)-like protein/PAS domain S-box-containing protein|nr:EAL domain-containing protein [Steroidobacteraceae bacterium]